MKQKTWDDEERDLFKKLCSIFCTRSEVCSVMGIDPKTLNRLIDENFRDEVNPGAERITFSDAFERFSGDGRAAIRRAQLTAALDGDKTMLIWLGKNYLGQSDSGARREQDEEKQPKSVEVTALDAIAHRRASRKPDSAHKASATG